MKTLYSMVLKYGVLPLADKAMKTSLASSYKLIKKMNHLSPNEIIRWQNRNLCEISDHAYTHTKYYKKVFNETGILPKDIKSREDLAKLPVLTKELIRENFDDILPDNLNTISYKKSATGGSTGDPLRYLLDNRSWSMSNANTIINWEKVGYNYGDRYIALGSTSLFVNKRASLKHRIYYKIKNKVGLSGVNMSDDICRKYIDLIKQNNVGFIYGYASSIYLLARHVLAQNEKLNIRACFTTSEVLTENFRNTIKDAFQCEIIDCYGVHDGGITAFSLTPGYFEVGYNSIVRIDNPSEDGSGAALITDLSNYAMPLINYKLGDEYNINSLKNNDYPYNGQIINHVLGRTSDIIHMENGNTLTGPGFTILFKDLPVEHYSIEKDGMNSIKCSIVKLPAFNKKHEDLVTATFKRQMGETASFKLVYTKEIPLTKSGKRQYFKA